MKTTVLDRQSLFDVAIQHLGSAESAFDLALANNDLSVTDDLEIGRELELSDVDKITVFEYFSNYGLKPATGFTTEDTELIWEGIEFWGIEYDFVVS